jgi:Uma2 family endonuclease
MAMQTTAATQPEIIYPETDGEPMAQNTKQAEVMMTLKENLDALFADRDDVFVAIDHFWYPVKGHPEIRQAPDVMVVLGRPKGHRGSYKQWEEDNIPPQVVFEVASPGNTQEEWDAKLAFYEQYGVLEYYIYDPETSEWRGYVREGGKLAVIEAMEGWVSPLLGIRFGRGSGTDPGVYAPSGERFVGYVACVVRWSWRWRGSWRRVGGKRRRVSGQSSLPRNCGSWALNLMRCSPHH